MAAPQINISKRMIAVLIPDDGSGKSYDYMLVNPKIVSHSVQEAYLPTGEGCLSVDDNVAGLFIIIELQLKPKTSKVMIYNYD